MSKPDPVKSVLIRHLMGEGWGNGRGGALVKVACGNWWEVVPTASGMVLLGVVRDRWQRRQRVSVGVRCRWDASDGLEGAAKFLVAVKERVLSGKAASVRSGGMKRRDAANVVVEVVKEEPEWVKRLMEVGALVG